MALSEGGRLSASFSSGQSSSDSLGSYRQQALARSITNYLKKQVLKKQEQLRLGNKFVHREGNVAENGPCEENCMFNKLPCSNCDSYAVLQEQKLGGRIEQVWTIVDRGNPTEIDKIKTGLRNPFGWPFPLDNADKSNIIVQGDFDSSFNSNIDGDSSGTSATAPPLSRSVTPDSGLYDLSRGKPERFTQSIASQISASYKRYPKGRPISNSRIHSSRMEDDKSNQSAQEALEEVVASVSEDSGSRKDDSRSVSSAEMRYYIRQNFEKELNPTDEMKKFCEKCKNSRDGLCKCVNEREVKPQENTSNTISEFNNIEQSSITSEENSVGKENIFTPSSRPNSCVLNPSNLIKPNKVGVMITDNKELKTVCFAPQTDNRVGRFSNILAAESSPDNTEYETPKRTILMTQIAVGIAVVTLTGAVVMFFGSLTKTWIF